eukprot:9557371-Lingulodinium_polyedra.AAC.1
MQAPFGHEGVESSTLNELLRLLVEVTNDDEGTLEHQREVPDLQQLLQVQLLHANARGQVQAYQCAHSAPQPELDR